jgi:hypothetical protein
MTNFYFFRLYLFKFCMHNADIMTRQRLVVIRISHVEIRSNKKERNDE